MKTLIFLLVVISCSHSPEKGQTPSRIEEELPKVMEGIRVEKRVFYELKDANNILRNTKEATIALWVKPTDAQSYQNLVSLSVGGENLRDSWKSRASILMTPRGELQSAARAQDPEDKSEVTTVPGVLKFNEWQHVAVTINYAQKKIQFHVNGTPIKNAAEDYNFITPETADTPSNRSSIGAEDDGSSGYFSGSLTEVHILRKILSADEIKELMEKTKP